MRRAMAFLTPFGRSAVPSRAALVWFPGVGAAVGAAVGGAWWVAGRWWPPLVAAVLAVLTDAAHLLSDLASFLISIFALVCSCSLTYCVLLICPHCSLCSF